VIMYSRKLIIFKSRRLLQSAAGTVADVRGGARKWAGLISPERRRFLILGVWGDFLVLRQCRH